jgi:hypothetical protein
VVREIEDKVIPFFPILRRRDNRFVPEGLNNWQCGKLPGHEAQLHERANVILQQPIVNLIHVREIINRLSAGIFVVQAIFVIENRMKSDIFETSSLLDFAKIAAVVLSQRQFCASGAKHEFPIVWKRARWGVNVHADRFRPNLCIGYLWMEDQKDRQNQLKNEGGFLIELGHSGALLCVERAWLACYVKRV